MILYFCCQLRTVRIQDLHTLQFNRVLFFLLTLSLPPLLAPSVSMSVGRGAGPSTSGSTAGGGGSVVQPPTGEEEEVEGSNFLGEHEGQEQQKPLDGVKHDERIPGPVSGGHYGQESKYPSGSRGEEHGAVYPQVGVGGGVIEAHLGSQCPEKDDRDNRETCEIDKEGERYRDDKGYDGRQHVVDPAESSRSVLLSAIQNQVRCGRGVVNDQGHPHDREREPPPNEKIEKKRLTICLGRGGEP